MFGLTRSQARRAGDILEVLGRDWRELIAGRDGFLVDKRRAGLYRHRVVWGEMDSMCLGKKEMYRSLENMRGTGRK
ncbi:hypothetical protein ACMFMG_010236 [Clarireedia jacksonii]